MSALQWGVAAKREGRRPITKYYVYGERCSGTNYAHQLIGQNSRLFGILWGHKHSPPWYELPEEKWLGPKFIYHFSGCEKVLFIIVVRNAYDWSRSLRRTPHGAHKSLYGLPLSDFIRRPWILDDNDPWIIGERRYNPLLDMDPQTGQPFANVFKLRTAKLQAMLQLMQRAPNAYLVRYEDLRDHPREVLEEIAQQFDIAFHREFTPINRYKGCPYWDIYEPKKYDPFSDDDIAFIHSQLDHDLETSLGY